MPHTVKLTARAVDDLNEAREYIAQAAPDAASQWYDGFLLALLILEKFPLLGGLAAESEEFPFELRQFTYRTRSRPANRALYTVVASEVVILAIRRPGQPLLTRGDLP